MSDKRANPRVNLLEFQPVHDLDTGKTVGYVGDVSREGLKLLSKKPVPSGRRLRLRLLYTTFGGGSETPEVEAESIWERRGDGQAFVETGLRFVAPDADALASVERIVVDLRERESR